MCNQRCNKTFTLKLMQVAAFLINHDQLNKIKILKTFFKRNIHEVETYVICFCYEQYLHQHIKHKQNVDNYFFLIINVLRKKK